MPSSEPDTYEDFWPDDVLEFVQASFEVGQEVWLTEEDYGLYPEEQGEPPF